MDRILSLQEGTLFLSSFKLYGCSTSPLKLLQVPHSFSSFRKITHFHNYHGVPSCFQGSSEVAEDVKSSPDYKADICNDEELDALPHIQTLSKFPKEGLVGKVVMVRFDATILLREDLDVSTRSVSSAVDTIMYLCEAGAKIILVSDWGRKTNVNVFDMESISDILSSVLRQKVIAIRYISCGMPLKMEDLKQADIFLLENLSMFKEEVANCSKFAELLSSGVDIFVNDSFSLSHKILASTVGIAGFCSASIAGFHFEESLCQLKKTVKTNKRPYVAIIGGGNLHDKAAALRFLASRCDGLIFVGMLSFQIMHALGHPIPSNLIERGALEAAVDIIQIAHERSIPIICPKDFWATEGQFQKRMEIVPAHSLLDGWLPVDVGPRSLKEMNSLLTKCKKVIWIGPMKFKFSSPYTNGASKLAKILNKLSQSKCDVTVVGNMASKSIMMESNSSLLYDIIDCASVVWEFFEGRKLHGILALDRAYPFEIDWSASYRDPALPLVVDIGCGNGMFLLGMARRSKDLNFLGLEINRKLVRRCLESVHHSGIQNGYFIATNATSTFRSIVSSYPGKLVLVSIQCPNPDFNNPEHRWRMLQRSLVEAIADLLAYDGKVFLQSDIETVAARMKELFLKYSKGTLTFFNEQDGAKLNREMWLDENPFGVRSDWEQHVLDRGAPMYRLMLSKSTSVEKH